MAGIYLHVPFCKSKCNYCDFYSGTQFRFIDDYVNALCREIRDRAGYLKGEIIETIYFGGGTPSLLSINQLNTIFEEIRRYHRIDQNIEISFECNPENINLNYIEGLKSLGINRISIGIQSFDDAILKFLGRNHSAAKASSAVEIVKAAGVKNVSVDFIYAIPGLSDNILLESLQKAVNLHVKHISIYNLTISENTKLYWKLRTSHIAPVDEEVELRQFYLINNYLVSNGFAQYEISNYSVEGFESRHNLSYWSGIPYLGLGPSAHSFDGNSRQWNTSVLSRYINSVNSGTVHYEIEYLSEKDRYNEYILTNLRTYKGLNIRYLKDKFSDLTVDHFMNQMELLKSRDYFTLKDDIYYPNRDSLIMADYLSTFLMIV